MNLPQHAGRYIGRPAEWTVSESGDNKIPTFVCRWALDLWLDGPEWVDVSGENLEITSYSYLWKKDGQPNKFAIDALRDSIGWDGQSLAGLAMGQWGETEAQLTIDYEEYKGKKKIKVQFINPRDSQAGGGLQKADPQAVQSLDAKYGPTLRALAGNAPAAAPKPTAPRAPAPSRMNGGGGTAVMEPPPSNGTGMSPKMTAWSAFMAKWRPYAKENPDDAAARDERWRSAITRNCGDTATVDTLTDEQWATLAEEIKKNFDVASGEFMPW